MDCMIYQPTIERRKPFAAEYKFDNIWLEMPKWIILHPKWLQLILSFHGAYTDDQYSVFHCGSSFFVFVFVFING